MTIICIAIISAVCAVLWDKMIFIAPIFFCFIVYALYKHYFSKTFAIITTCFFILTTLYTQARQPIPDTLAGFDGNEITIEGTVISLPDKTTSGKTKFFFHVDKLYDLSGNERLVNSTTQAFLNFDSHNKVKRGDNLKLKANIIVPESLANEGEFDYGKYLSHSGVFTLSFVNKSEVSTKKTKVLYKILNKIDTLRDKIIVKHYKYLSKDKTEILGGIVFGSEAIKPSEKLKKIFIESGLYHLLAASGMNVAFIFGIWFFILSRLKAPYNFSIISGGIVVLFYALMTGLPPSVLRATWMLELGLFGKLLDRTANNNVVLLFVCALLLLYNPMLLNDIGFILSFMVTFGLINFAIPLIDSIKFISPKISSWFIIPFVAQIFAIPIQIYYFQTVSFYSIIANMLVVPFMAIISFCGFISSILAIIPKIGNYICLVLDKINEPFLSYLYFIAENFSNIPNNIASVAKLNFIEVSLYYILLFLIIYMIKNGFKNLKINIATVIIFICIVVNFSVKGYDNDLTLTFLNVGEGDSIFIKTPDNNKILVDAGRIYGKNKNSGTSVILPYLKVNGINSIDMMILTHPDTDHIGGSVDVLKNINVNKIITNGESAKNKTYQNLRYYIKTKHINEETLSEIKEISPDKNISIMAFKPPDTNLKSQNDTSIILLIKYKNFDAILMGDNETNSYPLLKKYLKPTGRIEVFKVGHHGSKHSINENMVKLIYPKISIFSVGENSYGHPSKEALELLQKSRIYRTDINNSIKIKTNGANFDVYTYNKEKSCWKKNKSEN